MFACPVLFSQTITGRISGTVTDASGAGVPGANVIVTNQDTQLARSLQTDGSGSYVAPSLAVGKYSVRVEASGFKPQVVQNIELVADGRITTDVALQVGDVSSTVEVVEASAETVNTVSGEIARIVDTKQVQALALNGRNYMQLVSLIPGAALTNANQLDLTTSLSVTNAAVNGNRSNTNNLNVDGTSNLDSGSNGSQYNNVGIDFIREVKIQTSNFSAEYGRQSGAAINVVTKSGTNEFHGSAFEFFRNDKLDARSFFAPRRGKLRFNDFGYSLGGPIIKNKLFFFGGQEWKIIRRDTDAALRTLPTRAERRGDFSQTRQNLIVNYPGTTTPIPGQNIASMITPDGRALAKVYDAMELLASSYTDTPTGNNAVFQLGNPFDVRQDLLRFDYVLNTAHSLYGRYIFDDYVLIEPYGTFSGSNLPTTPTERRRPGTSWQISHTWVASPLVINEAKVAATWNGQRIPPVGDTWKRETYGFQFPQLFGGGWYPNGIPSVDLQGFSNFRGPSFALMSPTTDFTFMDTATFLLGSHTIRTGGMLIRNRKDQNGRPQYTGFLNFNTAQNTNTTGNAVADMLLGNFRRYEEAESDPVGFFRYTQFEAFAVDQWKLTSKLNIELGVRYQYALPIYTQANNIANFDPSLYNPAQAVTMTNAGLVVAGSGNRYNGLIRAADSIPADQVGRVAAANTGRLELVPTGAPRGLYEAQGLFAPRVSLAYSPDGKTSIRSGFGIFYDRPEGNIIFGSVNVPPFSNVVQFENGNLGAPAGGSAAPIGPWGNIDTIDPKMQMPYTMNYSFSIQREMAGGLFAEVAYVGNGGRKLLYYPNINQPTFAELAANAAGPRLPVNSIRPYKGFSEIRQRQSAAVSNYNALQMQLTRRRGALTFSSAYTWSKVLTDASGNGDNVEEPYNRSLYYGPATFDRRHVFVGTWTYALPFLMNQNNWLETAFGGWEISGIGRAQSGQLYSVNADTAIGGRRADYNGQEVNLENRTVERYFNTAAFTPAPDSRRGTAGTGIVQGPGMILFDVSARKNFRVSERIETRLQADMFNMFNHANFNGIETNRNNQAFGRVTGVDPGRNIQLALRLTF